MRASSANIGEENGNVYLNNLIPYEKLGQHEHIGLLVELYEASKVYKLPNVEFVQWFDDHPPAEVNLDLANNRSSWPHGPKAGMAAGVPPVVSWGKSEDSGVMMVPYCGAFRCPADSFDALAAKIDTEERVPWAERTDVAFGRWNGFCTYYYGWPPGSNAIVHTRDGKPVPCPRLHLNSLSEAHPDLLDAYDLGKRGPVPLAEQRKYKYIVSTDGWSISSKFDKYLLMGSTVLKAESHRIGFYYPALRPREHFLPFMVDSMDDIVDVVKWAREHDAEAKKIGESAAAFARQHLSRPARLCYLFHVVNELSKQFKYTPSCSRRKLCVPLVDELRFLSEDERANGTCNYREVLDKYGKSDAASSPKYGHKELLALHTDPLHWPRDDVKA
ncbi:hypothetical protein HYH03_012863 [Edaphochlamys debaryana]|uniref:Glycosyl transferase CAP10 domain-containing protein n=1 Tax=Edaphochlamys debaryana TaxID=47281 RepID=A0A836BV21_9CHLO|nr:hypothetical protein HYH03_012863 [Edaphochlamys debaryana]|eukprot:KAG2488544.1 hypothetical protein HYH03_012863 [Edaphochlamys debaryana]